MPKRGKRIPAAVWLAMVSGGAMADYEGYAYPVEDGKVIRTVPAGPTKVRSVMLVPSARGKDMPSWCTEVEWYKGV